MSRKPSIEQEPGETPYIEQLQEVDPLDMTPYQRGYCDGFDAPANAKARAALREQEPGEPLREAAQAILDRALDFFDEDDLTLDSSFAMPVTLKARHVAALRAALDHSKDEEKR